MKYPKTFELDSGERIHVISQKDFIKQVEKRHKQMRLERYSVNRHKYEGLLVGDRFYQFGFVAPWYATRKTIRNWFFQRWVEFYEADYLMVKNYRVFGARLSILRNIRLRKPYGT